jgi:prephenate dehydrogenase
MPSVKTSLPRLRRVTIVGVGLLGGSIGLRIKRLDKRIHVAGVGRRRESLDEAMGLGAIDSAHVGCDGGLGESDLVILATPVGAFAQHLRAAAPRLRKSAVVTDVGSTKQAVVAAAQRVLGPAGRFVGSHPMAGSDQRGPAAARADLLEGAVCIMTPVPATPPAATRLVRRFWAAMGMRVLTMTPREHDSSVARVSHLPHVLSALLMLLPQADDLRVAASGFRDMTRLAGGDVEMWRDILLTNRREILAAIDGFDERLMYLRDLVETADADGIAQLLSAARARRGRA